MNDERDEAGPPRGTALVWTGGALGVVALSLLILWTQRAPIAENLVSRELNARGVQARYDLVDVGFRTQRIENIVLGDPQNPDLTARWVEVDIGLAGLYPTVSAVRAGGVRMHARLKGGKLRLGELDKFRNPRSTEPFGLPDIGLSLKDARMRLESDAGVAGVALDGRGNLRSGFTGKLAAAMPRADFGHCSVRGIGGMLDISVRDGSPHISGPVRATALGCPGSRLVLAAPAVEAGVTFGKALDRWSGTADISGSALRAAGVTLANPSGRAIIDGNAAATRGQVRLGARALSGAGVQAGRIELSGRYDLLAGNGGKQGMSAHFEGQAAARQVRPAKGDPLAGMRAALADSPLAPLAQRLADAVRAAGRDNQARVRIGLAQEGRAGTLRLSDGRLESHSGARIDLPADSNVTIGWPGMQWALNGSITMRGGGLPDAALRLSSRPDGGVGGQLFMQDYAAGKARLSMNMVRFIATGKGESQFITALRLDGPLPGGGVRGLSLPVEGYLGRNGAIRIGGGCRPVGLTSLQYGGFALGRTKLTLCPADGRAFFANGPKGMAGGVLAKAPRLEGRIGDSPLRLAAQDARFLLGSKGFAAHGLDVAIGQEGAPVRIRLASLDGTMAKNGPGGQFAGGSGKIGTVPLLLSDASGRWQFDAGRLALGGGVTVADAQGPGRFNPLVSRDLAFAMGNGRITASGNLLEPKSGARIAAVDIVHDLGTGRGKADLNVDGLTFNGRLQPDALTPLALGVVANVQGVVNGQGQIRWTGDKVASDGRFRTENMNLAAAFGPVSGLSGEIRFSDLLGLETPPGQEVRIASVNPGIEATDGVIRYQLLPNQQARIESGEWPFSGGQLSLLPTVMDFSAEKPRNLKFRVIGLQADAFINKLDLQNIAATGTFDGLLPMIFDQNGGRIEGGVLVARQQGRPPLYVESVKSLSIPCDPRVQAGTLSYVGQVSNENLGTYGKLAFDALKNMRYKCLTIFMDGALDGEVVTQVVFNGVNQGTGDPKQAGMFSKFIGLPFIFNVRVEAPFRGLLNTAQSFVDPSGLIRSSLGNQYQAAIQNGLAVQPSESDTVRTEDKK